MSHHLLSAHSIVPRAPQSPKKNKYKKKNHPIYSKTSSLSTQEEAGSWEQAAALVLFPTGSCGGGPPLLKALAGMGRRIWGKKRRKAGVAQSTMRHHLKAKGLRRTLVPQWTSPERTW